MRFFRRLFGQPGPPPVPREPEQAVRVHLQLSDTQFGSPTEREAIGNLSDRLDEAIRTQEAGEFDGDEFGDGECVLYMYGPDADKLFAVVEPLLRATPLCRGGYAIKRYGQAEDEAARQVRVEM